MSYQKMVGQLQEAGNTTTIAHYLRLLGEAGLVCGLGKFYEETVREKSSSPKLAVCNNALRTAMCLFLPNEMRKNPTEWGHAVESAVSAHLIASSRRNGVDVLYWNVGCKEVDYVLRKGSELAAIEVKSADADSVSGMHEFKGRYPRTKNYLIGGRGMSLDVALDMKAEDLF